MTFWPSVTACWTITPSIRVFTATAAMGSTQPTDCRARGTSSLEATALITATGAERPLPAPLPAWLPPATEPPFWGTAASAAARP